MAQINVADLHPVNSMTFLDDLSNEKTISILGGRLSRWQLENLDRKFYYLEYRQHKFFQRMSNNVDQRMYNEIMSWDFPDSM